MKKKLFIGLFIGFPLFFLSSIGQAVPLTWQLTGEVFQVGTPLTHVFSVGDSVNVVFTFEPETPDCSPADPAWGIYRNAISIAQVSVGSYSATIEHYEITIANDVPDYPHPPFDLFGFANPMPTTILTGDDLLGSDGVTYRFDGIRGHFKDTEDADMLSSDSLPTSPLQLNEADIKRFDVAWVGAGVMNGVAVTNLELIDITPQPVPISSTILFFSTGLSGFAILRRRLR